MDALGSQSIQEGRGRPQEGGTAGMPRSGKRNGIEVGKGQEESPVAGLLAVTYFM